MIRQTTTVGLLIAAGICATVASTAAAELEFNITIHDHLFTPATLEVPAGQRIKLVVVNQDATEEEFESHDLHVEKIVSGGKSISVFVGPLDPGTFDFVGEHHEDTAKGTLVAK